MYCETRGTDILIIPKNSQGAAPIVQNGTVTTFTKYPDAAFVNNLVKPLNARGYNIPESGWLEEIISLDVGDPVPNWNEYQEL